MGHGNPPLCLHPEDTDIMTKYITTIIVACIAASEVLSLPRSDPTTHPNWRLLNNNGSCGMSQSFRIIGGVDAGLGRYPWLVRLGYKLRSYADEEPVLKCGGSIISKKYVLTANHCFTKYDYLVYVRVGEYDASTDPDCDDDFCAPSYVDYGIEQIKVHHRYSKPVTFANDITLIRIKGEIRFHDFASPICIEYGPLLYKDYVGLPIEVAGWGIYDLSIPEPHPVLQTVTMPVVSLKECQEKLVNKTRISGKQICAGGVKGKDSCGGDSGGPLMRPESVHGATPKYYLIGIVSFGTKYCAKTTMPAVYTRVASYLPWILHNIRE